jgi:hypothetical protein
MSSPRVESNSPEFSKINPENLAEVLKAGMFQGHGYAKFMKEYAQHPSLNVELDQSKGILTLKNDKGDPVATLELKHQLSTQKPSTISKWMQTVKNRHLREAHGGLYLDSKIDKLAQNIVDQNTGIGLISSKTEKPPSDSPEKTPVLEGKVDELKPIAQNTIKELELKLKKLDLEEKELNLKEEKLNKLDAKKLKKNASMPPESSANLGAENANRKGNLEGQNLQKSVTSFIDLLNHPERIKESKKESALLSEQISLDLSLNKEKAYIDLILKNKHLLVKNKEYPPALNNLIGRFQRKTFTNLLEIHITTHSNESTRSLLGFLDQMKANGQTQFFYETYTLLNQPSNRFIAQAFPFLEQQSSSEKKALMSYCLQTMNEQGPQEGWHLPEDWVVPGNYLAKDQIKEGDQVVRWDVPSNQWITGRIVKIDEGGVLLDEKNWNNNLIQSRGLTLRPDSALNIPEKVEWMLDIEIEKKFQDLLIDKQKKYSNQPKELAIFSALRNTIEGLNKKQITNFIGKHAKEINEIVHNQYGLNEKALAHFVVTCRYCNHKFDTKDIDVLRIRYKSRYESSPHQYPSDESRQELRDNSFTINTPAQEPPDISIEQSELIDVLEYLHRNKIITPQAYDQKLKEKDFSKLQELKELRNNHLEAKKLKRPDFKAEGEARLAQALHKFKIEGNEINNPETFLNDRIDAYLAPYIQGKITAENVDMNRPALIESLYAEFQEKFPNSKLSKDDLEVFALDAYIKASSSHFRQLMAASKGLLDPKVVMLNALQDAVAIDFNGSKIGPEKLQDKINAAVATMDEARTDMWSKINEF